MEKVDQAVIELLEKMPPEWAASVASFGISIPSDWADLSKDEKLDWLDKNRTQIVSFIEDLAKHLELLAKALNKKANPIDLMRLWKFVGR